MQFRNSALAYSILWQWPVALALELKALHGMWFSASDYEISAEE